MSPQNNKAGPSRDPAPSRPKQEEVRLPEPLEANGEALEEGAMIRPSLSCVRRLPSYLQMLRVLQEQGQEYVSGTVLAGVHNLAPVIVRKDLAFTGITGTPRIGFRVKELIDAIERFLGWDNRNKAVLVGVGNLGSALLGYAGFATFGLQIVAAFDADPGKIDTWNHGCKVQHLDQLPRFVRRSQIQLGVLTVPAAVAQQTASLMVDSGIRGIWNFTPVKLHLPADVVTQKEDLSEGLAVLSHRMTSRSRREACMAGRGPR
jgi:redox-sensing transcriptional repressor